MFAYLIALVRLLGFALWLSSGLFLTALVFPLIGWPRKRRIIRLWSRFLLRTLGVRLVVTAQPPEPNLRGVMVSNHSSWVDIFAANAVQAVRFISKSEVRDWPILGSLVTLAGTLYVERGNRSRINQTNEEIRAAVEGGDLVGFYPEGTTTDGTHLLPFKTNLFQPAVAYGMTVYPVAVMYRVDGAPTQLASYAGDTTFGQSFMQLLLARGVEAQIAYGAPIDARQFANRADLALAAQEAIAQMTGLSIVPPSEVQAARLSGQKV